MKKSKRIHYLLGTVVALLAMGSAFLYFLAPAYLGSFLIFIIGCILCGIAIRLTADNYSCNQKVSAVLVSFGFEQFKSHITSSPIFTYQYQGKTYTSVSAECLSQHYVLKHYKKDETYTIYLSPKDPSYIKISRRLRVMDILFFLLGFAFILLAVLSVFIIKSRI